MAMEPPMVILRTTQRLQPLHNRPALPSSRWGTFEDLDGDQCADPGETIEYIEVVNTEMWPYWRNGDRPIGDRISGPLASLAPSFRYRHVHGPYTITQADIDAGMVTNQATAEGIAPNGSTVSDLSDDNVLTEDDPTVTLLCQNPAIAIVKVGVFNDENGNQCTDPDETITYTFTVTNEGNVVQRDGNGSIGESSRLCNGRYQ